jgi:hypothetical protein|tara:strand:- start:194 stop:589 length:396 start_codon:yes stop_codon:yes gene_type:complete
MSDPQQDDTGGQQSQHKNLDPAIKAVMPSGKEVHDAIMIPIEPDLTTENLPLLDQKYANETPEELKNRKERYRIALQKYDIAFAEWLTGVNAKADQYKEVVLSHARQKSGAEDAGALSRLETEFSESDNDE